MPKVWGPATPSAESPYAAWKRRSAAPVPGPNWPSTVTYVCWAEPAADGQTGGRGRAGAEAQQ
ncbi:hypothetical protein AB1388_26555 [Streptomyces hydrogenans]|uniref:hypothetical protein n=1 Tax=Streptomyces hydrogenans TaxID=1873719 RepID=UPI00345D77B4